MNTETTKGLIKTPFAHVRYVKNGINHTKIVRILDFKSIEGIKNLCGRMRRKEGAEAFEVALVYDRYGATIFKIVLEYVNNNRWIRRH